MKKIYIAMAMLAMTTVPTLAQDPDDDWGDDPVYTELNSGYYRFVNNGYGDVLNTSGKYALAVSETENGARTLPGTIFYYDTNGRYSFADDMAQFGDNISVAELMQLMATSSWKSGDFVTYDLTSQGISFGGYLTNLRKYVDAAADNFAESDEVKDFYENGPAWFLQVGMVAAFPPPTLESLEAFKVAVNNFMQQWKNYFDCNIYVKAAQNIENGFLLHFHSPLDIAKMSDTQEQINSMYSDEGSMGYNYDFFSTFKRKVVEEAAKELDAEGVAYIERVLAPIEFNKEYYIGENEQGELYVTGFSQEAMFGEGDELANINQDELLWIMQPVDEENPLMVQMNKQMADQEGNYYTTMFTEFAYELKDGVEAYYIDAVNDGVAHLTQIVGKVPAETGVILCSKSAAAVSNTLIPTDEAVEAIEGNLLKGTCLPMDGENVSVMAVKANGETGNIVMAKAARVGANACYIDTPADGSDVIITASASAIPAAIESLQAASRAGDVYDLQGRRIDGQRPVAGGLYIQDGKKIVVK